MFKAYPSRSGSLNHSINGQSPRCRIGVESFYNITTASWRFCISICVQLQRFGQLECRGKYAANYVSILSFWNYLKTVYVSIATYSVSITQQGRCQIPCRPLEVPEQLEEHSLKRLLVMS